jgi:hypothetical protein
MSTNADTGIVGTLAGFFGGLLAALITAGFTSSRERRTRQLEFTQKQLAEFYSPLLALRAETHAEGVLRKHIGDKADVAWRHLVEESERMSPAEGRKLIDERKPEFMKVIEHDNATALEVLLPAYRKMVALFRDNMWLADDDTVEFYPQVVTYVSGLSRVLEKTVPVELVAHIATSEKELDPFYAHLRVRHDELRAIIESGR